MAERLGGLRIGASEYRELDSERVLVLVHYTGRGKMSGVEIGQMLSNAADLFPIRDGMVTRFVAYGDHELAFADLGRHG